MPFLHDNEMRREKKIEIFLFYWWTWFRRSSEGNNDDENEEEINVVINIMPIYPHGYLEARERNEKKKV